MTRSGFTVAPRPSDRTPFLSDGAYLDPADLLAGEVRVTTDARGKTESRVIWRGYAMAAARLVLTGEAWSEDDRTECAGYIAAAVMGQPVHRHGTAREVLAYIARVERAPLMARQYMDAIPAERASMTHLRHHAMDWLKAERRARTRLEMAATAAAERASFTADLSGEMDGREITLDLWTVRPATPAHATPMGQPHGAPSDVLEYIRRVERVRDHATAWPVHWGPMLRTDSRPAVALAGPRATAMDLLAALGLPRLGRAYPAALAAACSAAGMSGEEMAAAIGADRKTAEKRARRAMDDHVPSRTLLSSDRPRYTRTTDGREVVSGESPALMAHLDIIGVTAELETGKAHAAPREDSTRTDDGAPDCRCRTGEDGERDSRTPLECPAHPLTSRSLPGRRRHWDGVKSADWTRSMHPQTRARMAAAAKLARGRRA